jgi:hypothetical protein
MNTSLLILILLAALELPLIYWLAQYGPEHEVLPG